MSVENNKSNQIDENLNYSSLRRKQFAKRTNSDDSLEAKEVQPPSIITISGSIDVFNETQSNSQKDEATHKKEETDRQIVNGYDSIFDMSIKCSALTNNQLLWNLKGKSNKKCKIKYFSRSLQF